MSKQRLDEILEETSHMSQSDKCEHFHLSDIPKISRECNGVDGTIQNFPILLLPSVIMNFHRTSAYQVSAGNTTQQRGNSLGGWGQSSWKAAQRKRPWGCWLTEAEQDPVCAQVAKKANDILACTSNWPSSDCVRCEKLYHKGRDAQKDGFTEVYEPMPVLKEFIFGIWEIDKAGEDNGKALKNHAMSWPW
ncbi:hypothetical protein WISP_128695 [Willisornis vidua]|uniref:Uncharacterized protein n=1 Tax=Willisornis vidua TaxID=1566151 RepID=A0ABQ9CQA8_9PASS|nr:hypothetical protein WISP_128695 [Willisornis vidua]